MDDIDKKIFVIGSGRCGTSWIGQWLQRHPKTFGGPETHLFRILQPFLNEHWNQGIRIWMKPELLVDSIRQFANTVFGEYKHRKNEQIHLVEHSPIHADSIDFIKQIYPDALFIYLYRDGRNVVESWQRSGFDGTELVNARSAIARWIKNIQNMKERKDDPLILSVRYEDIMENVRISEEITKFLGIDHHYDIDSWEFPVNTSLFSYDYNRWKSLSSVIQKEFEHGEMLELLSELGYNS